MWREMYDRVGRAYAEAFESETSEALAIDRAYAFFLFCFHLKDWIKQDASVEAATQRQVEGFVTATPSLSLAGDVANGVKHLVRDRPARVDDRARVTTTGARLGMDFGLGTSPLGFGLVIVGEHGPRSARAVADDCVSAWNNFLGNARLL
jgi:hypothetical protein